MPFSMLVSVPLYAINAWFIATPYSMSVWQFEFPYTPSPHVTWGKQLASGGVTIGFTFSLHVIVPDKRHQVHWFSSELVCTQQLFVLQKRYLALESELHSTKKHELFLASHSSNVLMFANSSRSFKAISCDGCAIKYSFLNYEQVWWTPRVFRPLQNWSIAALPIPQLNSVGPCFCLTRWVLLATSSRKKNRQSIFRVVGSVILLLIQNTARISIRGS
jgi:hypothetical protein